MPRVDVNGVEIIYEDAGSGTPIVFIHGYPLNRSMWDEQVAALAGDARCITIDLRGHGESSAPHWLATVDLFADDIVAVLDALAIQRAVICGLSMGGYVSFALWRRHRQRIQAFVLADTRPQPDTPEQKQARFAQAQLAFDKGPSAIADALLPRLLTQRSIKEDATGLVARLRAIIESTPSQGMAADLMALAERPDSRDLLPGIDVPTLVIVGAEDALTPPADSQAMAAAIPGARLVEIANAGHMSNLEQPAAFNAALKEFLTSL